MADAEIVALREKLTSRPRSDDYRQRRRDMDKRGLAYGLQPDVKVEPVTANGVPAEWSSTPGATDDAALLYLHGGYVIGSLDSHRHLVAEAGRASGCWALALDIVLRPNIPFPPRSRMPLLGTAISWVGVSNQTALRLPAIVPAADLLELRWSPSEMPGCRSLVAAGASRRGSTWKQPARR